MHREPRRASRALLAALALAATLPLGACSRVLSESPSGFAPYPGETPYRSVSPDGVVYRVQVEANAPRADLGFWSEAMRRHLEGAGYRFRREHELRVASGEVGHALEMEAPAGDDDLAYLIGLVVADDRLVVVESAGEVHRFDARRDAVLAAISKIRIR